MPERPVTRRDSLDFRDRIYQPALIPLDDQLLPDKTCIHLRDQENEGACAGFGLAAVIDYLNRWRGEKDPVSPRMLYEMAKRHDQWPGESYEGTTARGAMKGWHKNGVCPDGDWPYAVGEPGHLDAARQRAALAHPLGAYYRVLPKRSDVHAALGETHAVYVTADTHIGWDPDRVEDGIIPYKSSWVNRGGHAFAIVGYTEEGFIVQNSWGDNWGGLQLDDTLFPGCAIWQYPDFEANVWDIWVARLALPVEDAAYLGGGRYVDAGGVSVAKQPAPPQHEIRDHYLHIDDGGFDPFGDYPSGQAQAEEIIGRAVGTAPDTETPNHIVLYAHGGLNNVKGSARRVSKWRPAFERNRVHELHFIWETGLKEELRDVLLGKEDFAERRAGGVSDWFDKVVERATGFLGRALWGEMQTDAAIAFEPGYDGTKTLGMLLTELNRVDAEKRPKLHLVGHSAGSIWFAHLLERWRELDANVDFANLVLFAPACTVDLFNSHIRPAIEDRTVKRFTHFMLDDDTERDDNCAKVYRKSLLYLVSRAYQQRGEVVPILGMEKYWKDVDLDGISGRVRAYNTRDHRAKTMSDSHGGFDNDAATMNAMMRIIAGADAKAFEKEELEDY